MISKQGNTLIVGIAWYRSADWERLLQLFPDRSSMQDSHREWLVDALRTEQIVQAEGRVVKRVIIHPGELARWCRVRGLRPDAQARARYVTDKVRQESRTP